MDYFEGLLLGVQWSDTDFENRRHISSLVLYGIVVNALLVLTLFTGRFQSILHGQLMIKLIVFFLLFFACPFICFRYYRLPLWGKIPILIVQTMKQLALTLIITDVAMSRIHLPQSGIMDRALEFLNATLESHALRYEEAAGTFATVLGVLSGGIYIVFATLVVLFIAILIPAIAFVVVRLIQRGYDMLIEKLVIKQFINR